MGTATEIFDKITLKVTKIFEQSRKHQDWTIRSFRKLVISRWKKNIPITDYELNSIFKDLYRSINDSIWELDKAKGKAIKLPTDEEGLKLYAEFYRIVSEYMEELEADKKKLQKLKSGWKTVLAGYEDEEQQE